MRERQSSDFCRHGFIAGSLFRAVGEVPDQAIHTARVHHSPAPFDTLRLKDTQGKRHFIQDGNVVQGNGERSTIFHRHGSALRHVREHSMRRIADNDQFRRRRSPARQLGSHA